MPSESEPTPPRTARRFPLGLLGMIALIVGVESFVMRHDDDLTTLVATNWELEGRAPARQAAKHEILCFGDSMVKFGIQPRILSGVLGRSTYNHALYCGPPQSSYYMLARALDAGAKPEAIVVDFQPELLMGDAMTLTSRVFPELLGFRELLDLCWQARLQEFRDPHYAEVRGLKGLPASDRLAEFAIARLLPSARKRYEIRAAIVAAIGGQSVSAREKLIAVKRNWKLNSGAEVLPKNPHYHGDVPEAGAYPAMFWTPWKANPLSEVYLERFLALAADRKIPVFWLLQPNANAVDLKREQVGYNAQYEAFVRRCQDRYVNLVVVDGRHVNYPGEYFTDPVHLDKNGAGAYSFGVAEVMKSYLDGTTVASRWFPLPDRRGRSEELPLEDSTQSAIAIKADEAKAVR